jgi:hypothetical protein
MSGIVCGQLKDPSQATLGRESKKHKELIMNNQNSGNGGASPKLQAMVDPASKDTSGQGPAADSFTGTSTPADTAGQSAASGTIVPASEKGGHN